LRKTIKSGVDRGKGLALDEGYAQYCGEYCVFPLICRRIGLAGFNGPIVGPIGLERFGFYFPHLKIGLLCVWTRRVGFVSWSRLSRSASEGPNILETVPSLVDFSANRNCQIDPSSATQPRARA
jgi:hypothetical protein